MGQHMNFSNHKHHNCDWSLLECEVGCYNMLTNSSIEIPHKTTNLVIQELHIIWAGYSNIHSIKQENSFIYSLIFSKDEYNENDQP